MASPNPSENVKELTQELINKDWSPLKATNPKGIQGIYVIGVDGDSKYIGRTKDFSRRFGEYTQNFKESKSKYSERPSEPNPRFREHGLGLEQPTDIDDITQSLAALNVADKETKQEDDPKGSQDLQQQPQKAKVDGAMGDEGTTEEGGPKLSHQQTQDVKGNDIIYNFIIIIYLLSVIHCSGKLLKEKQYILVGRRHGNIKKE